jgi:hypothetical protein
VHDGQTMRRVRRGRGGAELLDELVTLTGGRGSGKTTLAIIGSKLVGGYISISPKEQLRDMQTRLSGIGTSPDDGSCRNQPFQNTWAWWQPLPPRSTEEYGGTRCERLFSTVFRCVRMFTLASGAEVR